MKSRKNAEFNKLLVVTPERLQGFVTALSREIPKLEFQIECSDGTKFYPETLSELLEYPNPQMREIRTLRISTTYMNDQSLELRLSIDILGPARFEISGDDKFVVSISHQIEQHLGSMVAGGPHFFAQVGSARILASVLIGALGVWVSDIGFTALNTSLNQHKLTHLDLLNMNLGTKGSLAAIIIGSLLFGMVIWQGGLASRFFPKVAFCIGDGTNRYKRMSELRKQFGIAALIAVIVGVVSGLIVTALTSP